jgi:hypothetical protein
MWGKEINTTAYLLHDKDFEKELEQTFLKNREAEVGASASHRPLQSRYQLEMLPDDLSSYIGSIVD